MDLGRQVLSDIIFFDKYARYQDDLGRRETYEECINRNQLMHIKKFPEQEKEIQDAYQLVFEKRVLPSMRSAQFSGKAVENNSARIYNCAYCPIDDVHSFSEIMFLLLGGTGTGYSVQKHHVDKLPTIKTVKKPYKYMVQDSIEGWADAVKVLLRAYFEGKTRPRFDFSQVRAKGARLITSGGKAPGPEPLKICLAHIESILDSKEVGTKLTPFECHSILCHCADAVLAGGIRRAAMISFFDKDDMEMLYCKSGSWFETNPHLGRANNSVVFLRGRETQEDFDIYWSIVQANGTGEPGIFWTNDLEVMSNPCQPAWAPVLTRNGLSTIGKVKIGDEIWSETGWTKITNKWSTGIKEVYEYRTSSGVFYGTENHRVLQDGIKIEAHEAESIDILRGPFSTDYTIDYQDVMDGLVIGDGSVHQASNNKVLLMIGQDDQEYFQSEVAYLIKEKHSASPYTYDINTTIKAFELPKTYERTIPDRFLSNPNKLVGFLRGLFTANGSVINSGSGRLTLKGSSKKLIQQVQQALSSLGVASYITTNKPSKVRFSNGEYLCKESYDLNISTDLDRFMNLIGYIHQRKNETANLILENRSEKRNKKVKTTYDIQKVEFISEEEVFDLTVNNDTHTYWTGGINVSNCNEASLRPYTFCNLTTINAYLNDTQEKLNLAASAASIIGTLQASYTDFHYLRPIWKERTEQDALIGVSITGLATKGFLDLDLEQAALIVVKTNKDFTKKIGIRHAARACLIKPEGTGSLVLGTASGVHNWHSRFYIRRFRIGKNQEIYRFLMAYIPDLIEDDVEKPHLQAIVSIPIKAPDGAITREDETPIELLTRVKDIYERWIRPGWNRGENSHTVSVTVSIRDHEWEEVGKWMWDNRETYGGISVLPYYGGSYKQPPFEEINEEEYERLFKLLTPIDFKYLEEDLDNTNLVGELACAGGQCEVK